MDDLIYIVRFNNLLEEMFLHKPREEGILFTSYETFNEMVNQIDRLELSSPGFQVLHYRLGNLIDYIDYEIKPRAI